MKKIFLLIVITTAFALVSPSDAHAACELVTSQYKCVAPGAVTDQCEFNSMTSEYYMYTRAADSQCIVDGNNCEATFGAGHFCAKLEAWSMDCGECSTGPQQEEKSCARDFGGVCVSQGQCGPYGIAYSGGWSDCANNEICCDNEQRCSDLGPNIECQDTCHGACVNAIAGGCPGGKHCCDSVCSEDYCTTFGTCVDPELCPPGKTVAVPESGWKDCNLDEGYICCLREDEEPEQGIPDRVSCSASGGFCTNTCQTPLTPPSGKWSDCTDEQVCCPFSTENYNCESPMDPHREPLGCYVTNMEKSQTRNEGVFSSPAAITTWLNNALPRTIDWLFNFSGDMYLENVKLPIKGELHSLVGYFPPDTIDGKLDGNNAPDKITGVKELLNTHDFKVGPIFKLAPPDKTDAVASWIPAMFKNYGHSTMWVRSCINSRTEVRDGKEEVVWPTFHYATRGPYGLFKSMYNEESQTGLWAWIARTPERKTQDSINFMEDKIATRDNNTRLANNSTKDDIAYTTQNQQSNVLAQSTSIVPGTPGCDVGNCEEDTRNALQYEEKCVLFNGYAEFAGGKDITYQQTPENCEKQEDTSGIFSALFSHTEREPMRADPKGGYLYMYWPLKFEYFASFIPPSFLNTKLYPSESKARGFANINHLGGVVLSSAEVDFEHGSGWAKTAEEMVLNAYVLPKEWQNRSTLPSIATTSMPSYYAPPIQVSEDFEALASEIEAWANAQWGEGSGDRAIYLALTQGETNFGENCGKCVAWDEYETNRALNTEEERNRLRQLAEIWEQHDIRNQNPLAAQYIPSDYDPEKIVGSCGGGALGISQLIPSTAWRNLPDVGEPYDLWDPETAMRAMAVELHKLGWHKDLNFLQKINVLLKWNGNYGWVVQIVRTARQYLLQR